MLTDEIIFLIKDNDGETFLPFANEGRAAPRLISHGSVLLTLVSFPIPALSHVLCPPVMFESIDQFYPIGKAIGKLRDN